MGNFYYLEVIHGLKKLHRPDQIACYEQHVRNEGGLRKSVLRIAFGAPQSLNITRWERGTAFPSAHYVNQLCSLFGKSARELGLIEDELPTMPEQDELISDFKEAILSPFLSQRAIALSLPKNSADYRLGLLVYSN